MGSSTTMGLWCEAEQREELHHSPSPSLPFTNNQSMIELTRLLRNVMCGMRRKRWKEEKRMVKTEKKRSVVSLCVKTGSRDKPVVNCWNTSLWFGGCIVGPISYDGVVGVVNIGAA